MWKILRFRYRSVLKQNIRKEKRGAAGLTAGLGRLPGRPVRQPPRPPCRPNPGHRPDHLGGTPASPPAWAGSQAGPPGCSPLPSVAPVLLLAWAGSLAGPLGWCPGSPAGLGRLPGRAAWLSQSFSFSCTRNITTVVFPEPLLKGLLPQINGNPFCQLLSYFLSSIVDFSSLAFSLISPIVLATFERKERGDLDPYFHRLISPISEGNTLDLDLWSFFVLLLCSSSLIPPKH